MYASLRTLHQVLDGLAAIIHRGQRRKDASVKLQRQSSKAQNHFEKKHFTLLTEGDTRTIVRPSASL
jgi:hypothetical protein